MKKKSNFLGVKALGKNNNDWSISLISQTAVVVCSISLLLREHRIDFYGLCDKSGNFDLNSFLNPAS